MAANEERAHRRLQEPFVPRDSPFVSLLMGTLVVTRGASKGERWLLFENRGIQSAAQYAGAAAAAFAAGTSLGEGEFWDRFDARRPLRRRRLFVVKVRADSRVRTCMMLTGGHGLSAAERPALVMPARRRDQTHL